jgi:F-box/leucine-rich repeat protein 10/11
MSVQERKGMINNPSFRRSANCGKFSSLLSGKQLQTFPIQKIAACDLSQSWIDSDGLEKPVLIENVKGLGMKIPDSSTKLSDIAAIIGTDFPIKIISVGEQIEIAGNIGEYAYYLANRTADHKLLNLISLEISATRLSGKVQSPNLVREVDWIDKCWPLDR